MGLFLKMPVGFLKKNVLENGIISENACRIPEKKISWTRGLFQKTPVGFLKKNILENGIISENACRIPEKKYPGEWDYF